LTVGDLCRAARVSERVLEYAFRQHYGVSPRSFMKAFRLHGARRELRAADPKHATTVGEVASRWGFWHASQFATDYRRFFGELPSATLKRP
jgi:AraC family ethanolamine operon transcriptional activator